MGLQLTAVARWRGAHVMVSEPDDWRRGLAREFGAAHVINPSSQDAVEAVLEFTGGRGADAIILATGVQLLLNQALHMARQSGRVVLFAGFERPARVEIDPNLLHYKELVVTGSYWIGNPPHHHPELYQQAVDLIAQGVVPVKRLITSIYSLEQITQAFEAAADRRSLKVIVHMNGGNA
jgi:L-iditol 2-dehydrogenase